MKTRLKREYGTFIPYFAMSGKSLAGWDSPPPNPKGLGAFQSYNKCIEREIHSSSMK